jgi:cyclic beta-1,2-glucan synthetase
VFKHRSTRYEIAVANPNGVNRGVVASTLDGLALPAGEPRIQLLDDGATHRIEMILG